MFAGSLFEWTGGVISTSAGDLTNRGTMNLAGSTNKDIFNDGTLDNFWERSSRPAREIWVPAQRWGKPPRPLKIERGASYLIRVRHRCR